MSDEPPDGIHHPSDLYTTDNESCERSADSENECGRDGQNKRDMTKAEKVRKKVKKLKSKHSNKRLPSGIMFDLKSGFIKKDSEIPEPIFSLDLEYRLKLYDNLNR
ncbi:hypothetical protein BmR1_04g09895 [Babesia microti strain RI]|uniref:Uncharacterized protein n=1 Tax=Babesia microti (strain RI) TaxID=1133968 RepID=I7IA57_BABMR|nr:hypothetical protein BmR1_04g09895 [Babesia microti strain RI]CCF76144.1 hypothetical protein BmR1_04g09895 [Babesia microti strain RI]|eukprot:XP_012650552.1 hypothetical protein BmR1_04g09895 [Babesia microti strain RI]